MLRHLALLLLALPLLAGCEEDPAIAGARGPAGPAGSAGPQGPAGAVGERGPAGVDGKQGPAGAQGPMGPAGMDGAPGAPGMDGAPGAAGAKGEPGATGATGAQGVAGPKGPAGAVGPAGADGLPRSKADVYTTTASVTLPPSTTNNGYGGVTAMCAGPKDIVMSGSCEVDPLVYLSVTRAFNLTTQGSASGWSCGGNNNTTAANAYTITARANCIAVP